LAFASIFVVNALGVRSFVLKAAGVTDVYFLF